MVVERNKLFRPIFGLYIFFVFYLLLFLKIPVIVYIMFFPLFYYLYYTKKLHYIQILFLSFISASINYSYFSGFGIKFYILAVLAQMAFYTIFILVSFKLIRRSFYFISIPSFFFIVYYILHFTVFNNYWLTYIGFTHILPETLRLFGGFIHSSLIVMLNIILFKVYLFSQNKSFEIKFENNLSIFLLVILLLIFFITPFISLYQESGDNGYVKVLGIQTNNDMDWFERTNNISFLLESNLNQTKSSLQNHKADIVIWPEYTFSHYLNMDFSTLNSLSEFSDNYNITLIVGSTKLDNINSSESKRYNTLFIFNDGNISYYNAYKAITIFDPDIKLETRAQEVLIENTSIGLSLCFEENFPSVFTRQIINNNPELFFVIGNQHYFDNEKGLYLTSLSSKLRAFESNRYIFRLETTGLTTIIDNNGEYVKSLPVMTKSSLFYEIPRIKENTIYSRYSNYIDNSYFALSLLLLVLVLMRNRN